MRADEPAPPPLQALQDEVNEYASSLFASHTPHRYNDGKIVRDAVFGYQRFHPHEVSVIDSPLLQRLRYVHQTALAYLVYPCAHHSRFEHSLGVSILAGRVTEALGKLVMDNRPDKTGIREVRLAGLLHDCGHCLFSHLSESIMSQRFAATLGAIRASQYFKKGNVKFGEILSYLLVRSDAFGTFWDSLRTCYPDLEIDSEKIARLIVGEVDEHEQYKADIISGPFDADKLDYFTRDAHFTGVKVEVDIERLLHTVTILNRPGRPSFLVMKRGGVPHLEQILFSKMMLFSSIYHHHKIRALECMVKAIFETVWEDPSAITNPRLRLKTITDFLRVSEAEFLVKAAEEGRLSVQVNKLLQRDTLKRALVLNSATIRIGENAIDACRKFQTLAEPVNALQIAQIRNEIFVSLPQQFQTSVRELWLDLPTNPPLSDDAEQCKIEVDPTEEPLPLRNFFPSDEWVAAYGDNKWTGHVFYSPDDEKRRSAGEEAIRILSYLYNIEFTPMARDNCFK